MSTETALIITCEHGGKSLPARYAPLFTSMTGTLDSHRGYDIGALDLARYLARRLDAPLHYSTTSRLLIDLNRSLHHRRVFSEKTRALDEASRNDIINRYYRSYRDAVEKRIALAITRGRFVAHISVHSFTPKFDGTVRTADIGLLYDPARRGERLISKRIYKALRNDSPALRVRRNYPYKGTADGFTTCLRRTFSARHYAGIELEINQRFFIDARPRWREVRRRILHALDTGLG